MVKAKILGICLTFLYDKKTTKTSVQVLHPQKVLQIFIDT